MTIQPAPKQLALLAAATRGWPYEEIYAAILAAGHAGWTFDQVYREVTRLILVGDADGPADLRQAARNPLRKDPRPGAGLPSREDAVALVADYRARVAGQAAAASSDPEGHVA